MSFAYQVAGKNELELRYPSELEAIAQNVQLGEMLVKQVGELKEKFETKLEDFMDYLLKIYDEKIPKETVTIGKYKVYIKTNSKITHWESGDDCWTDLTDSGYIQTFRKY